MTDKSGPFKRSSKDETGATLAQIRNVTVLPEPEAKPISSSQANMDFIAEVRKLDKETKGTSQITPTVKAVQDSLGPLQDAILAQGQAIQVLERGGNLVFHIKVWCIMRCRWRVSPPTNIFP